MVKFATFVLFVLLSCTAFAVDKDEVSKAVKEDKISVQDCRKWYTVYKGAYIYVKELDAVGSNDFADVFDRIRVVRDKMMPEKGNPNWVKATNLSKYNDEDVKFTPEARTDLAEDLYQICEGLKAGMK
jgi:hypothetical protein